MSADSLTPTEALLVLSALPRLGPITVRRLLAALDNDPLAVLRADRARLLRIPRLGEQTAQVLLDWRKHVNPAELKTRLERLGVSFIGLGSEEYPRPLSHIYDPPVGLYCKGALRPGVKSVAIVGSRRTTLYGQSTARMLGRELAALGFCVVSGMARGIDTAAHQGALEAGGQTAAVLGCGVDIVYPPENIDLYHKIVSSGVVMSELPPGTRASRTTFPMRNRLISGLSAAVIVVETDKAGGSMITARFAAEHNRRLFAVPGRIDQSTSQGCHQLIREGAVLLTCVDDLLEELAYGGHAPLPRQSEDVTTDEDDDALFADADATTATDADLFTGQDLFAGAAGATAAVGAATAAASASASATAKPSSVADWRNGLNEDEQLVLGALRGGDRLDRDALSARCGLPVASVSAILLMLELRRRIAKRADGTFEAR